MNVKCFIRLTTGWGQCKKVSFFWAGDWRSPGLVVMGDDSCSKGHMFESRRCILDGHLDNFHIDLLYINIVICLKRPKINRKEAGAGPF